MCSAYLCVSLCGGPASGQTLRLSNIFAASVPPMRRNSIFRLFLLLLYIAAVTSCTKTAKEKPALTTPQIMSRLDTLVQQMNAAFVERENVKAIQYGEEGLELEALLPDDKKTYGDLHSHFGDLMEQAGQDSIAEAHFRIAIARVLNKKPYNYAELYHKTARLGSFYRAKQRDDSTKAISLRALRYAKLADNALWPASANNNYAYLFEEQGQIDSAEYYYDCAEKTLQLNDRTDSIFLGSIRDNKAHVLLLQKNYAAAEAAYRKNRAFYAQLRQDEGQVKTLFHLADVYSAAGNSLRALQLTDSTYKAFPKVFGERPSQRDLYLKMRYTQLKPLNRPADALAALQQLSTYRDSVKSTEKNMIAMLTKIASESELDRHKRENEVKELHLQEAITESKLNWIIGVGILFTSVLIIALLLLYSRKRSNEQKTKIRLAEAEIRTKQLEGEKLQHDLEMKQRDLTDLVLFHRQKKEIMDEVVKDLHEALQADDRDGSLKRLLLDLRGRSMATETLDLGAENIELVNKAFFEKLEAQFPDLSKGERTLCSLLRMNLSTKDIAQLRKITPESVKMSKKRLRKKLGLQPESDLYQFMQKI